MGRVFPQTQGARALCDKSCRPARRICTSTPKRSTQVLLLPASYEFQVGTRALASNTTSPNHHLRQHHGGASAVGRGVACLSKQIVIKVWDTTWARPGHPNTSPGRHADALLPCQLAPQQLLFHWLQRRAFGTPSARCWDISRPDPASKQARP